jgi:hypothetical protein
MALMCGLADNGAIQLVAAMLVMLRYSPSPSLQRPLNTTLRHRHFTSYPSQDILDVAVQRQ